MDLAYLSHSDSPQHLVSPEVGHASSLKAEKSSALLTYPVPAVAFCEDVWVAKGTVSRSLHGL